MRLISVTRVCSQFDRWAGTTSLMSPPAWIGKQIAKVQRSVCRMVLIHLHAVGEHRHNDPAAGFLSKSRLVDVGEQALGNFLFGHKPQPDFEANEQRFAIFTPKAAQRSGIR